jgi:hypothetical protein
MYNSKSNVNAVSTTVLAVVLTALKVEYGLYGQLSWDSVVTVMTRLLAG